MSVTVTVLGAAWGAKEGADDVTEMVQDIVDGGTYSFTADRKTFDKADPAPGHKKCFGIVYQVASPGVPPARHAYACEEGDPVTLDVSVTT